MLHLRQSKHFKRWIEDIESKNPEIDVNDIVFSIEHKQPTKEYYLEECQTDSGRGISREITDNNMRDVEVSKLVDKRLREHGLIRFKDEIYTDD